MICRMRGRYKYTLWITLLFSISVSLGNACSVNKKPSPILYKIILVLKKSVWPENLRRLNSERDDKVYHIVPIHLLELPEGIPGKKGQCIQFIFYLKCPDAALAGSYEILQ